MRTIIWKYDFIFGDFISLLNIHSPAHSVPIAVCQSGDWDIVRGVWYGVAGLNTLLQYLDFTHFSSLPKALSIQASRGAAL